MGSVGAKNLLHNHFSSGQLNKLPLWNIRSELHRQHFKSPSYFKGGRRSLTSGKILLDKSYIGTLAFLSDKDT